MTPTRNLRSLFLTLGLLALAPPLYDPAWGTDAEPSKPVAIIYALTGSVSLSAPDAARRPLRLFDRLPAGTALKVGARSRLALAFVNGLRYELGEGAQVTLGPQGLASHTGPVRSLPAIPPLAYLSPIAAEDQPGLGAGAVRVRRASEIRSNRITGLYPRRGAMALADKTVLRFWPVAGARRYRIEVQDSQGQIVFQADVRSPKVTVPARRLRAGLSYRWTVRTLDLPDVVARGEDELAILGEDAARAREKTLRILKAEGPDALPLLAEVDLSLGLLHEAQKDLRVALRRKPGNPVLKAALDQIETRLVFGDDPEIED